MGAVSFKGVLIDLDIAGLHPLPGQTAGKTLPWKLNQLFHATPVGNNSKGKQLFQIEGKTYSFLSSSSLESGKSLMMKVVSLSPPRLELTETTQNNSAAKPATTTALSTQLLLLTRNLQRGSMSNILHYISSLSSSNLQSLPPETLSLINILKKKIINAEDLSNVRKLKPAILQSGLLLESKLLQQNSSAKAATVDFDSDLKAILFKIFRSLEKTSTTLSPGKVLKGSQRVDGLSLYQDGNQEHERLKTQLKYKVDDVLSKITLLQKQSYDECQKGNQSWFFEVPANFPSNAQSIPVTISQNKKQQSQNAEDSNWQAEFSLDLESSGLINVRINITDLSASVSLQSEHKDTARALHTNSGALYEKFSECGLTLSEFNSDRLKTGQINA